jgi:hypothetical protein
MMPETVASLSLIGLTMTRSASGRSFISVCNKQLMIKGDKKTA